MKFVAVVERKLKPGKTYDDFRRAWFHTTGFAMPTTMYTVINAFDPREIISIGILDGDLKQLIKGLEIDVQERLANPLDDIIEETIVRDFGLVSAVDDFSAEGKLTYSPPKVDGNLTNYDVLAELLKEIATEIKKVSSKRDAMK